MRHTAKLLIATACAALLVGAPANPAQAAEALVPGEAYAIPSPQNVPRQGVIALSVDATGLTHRVLRVEQRIPVAAAGRLTLHYPRWIPGAHGPYGDFSDVSGISAEAAGQRLAWQRDPIDPYAIHIAVPDGTREVLLRYQLIGAHKWEQGRPTMTPAILEVVWMDAVLYPAGHHASQIRVLPRVKLPAGWQQASALRAADGVGVPQPGPDGWVQFGEASIETLMDSPLYAGQFMQRIALDAPGVERPVALNLFGDDAQMIAATPQQIAAHKALVTQGVKLFGTRPWRHYDFLLSLSDTFGGVGLEHHESSENGTGVDYFKDWEKSIRSRELLPHEFTHAWVGKFRRPADLTTPNYNVPMGTSLLWVYEGLTQYLGHVLAARAGLTSPALARDNLAAYAATMDARSGRAWRSLQDTTYDPALAARRSKTWTDEQRSTDYYLEGLLVWLDADTLIREKTNGKRSLDDFCRAFFGQPLTTQGDGAPTPKTFTFDDITAGLSAIAPHDWRAFLRQRLDATGSGAPLDGLARSGWKLGWADAPSENQTASRREGERGSDFVYSLGLKLESDGRLQSLRWGSPAFEAGLSPTAQLLAVNGMAYSEHALKEAVTAAKNAQGKAAPIELLVREGKRVRSVTVTYTGGLRHPRLERLEGTPDRLSQIYAARP